MAGGVDVNIGADTREFATSVRTGMQEPVADAQEALEQYARAGDQAGDQLEGSFRTQQQQTEKLRDEITELNRTIQTGSRPAYKAAAADSHEFTESAQVDMDEVKNSAKSNAIALGASFTGGFDQAVGGLQGFVSEVGLAFGPAGLIAGIGAAALLGTIGKALEDGTASAEEQKAAVAALAGEYIDLGRSGVRSAESVQEAIKSMATSDDVVITLQKAYDAARQSGVDYQKIVETIASGSPRQIGAARVEVERLQRAHQEAANAAAANGTANYRAAVEGQHGTELLSDALLTAEKQAREAGRAQRLAARAGLSDLSLKADLVEQLGSAYDDAAAGSDHFNEKTGEFDVTGFLKDFRKVKRALEDYREDVAKTDLTPAAVKFIESQGQEQAAAMLRGYKDSTPRRRRELNEIWTETGTENADSYAKELGDQLKGTRVRAPKIDVPRVPRPNTADLDKYLSTPAVKKVVVEAYTRDGKRVF